MNKRNFVRYGSELLPGNMSKVTVSWEGKPSIGSYVINYCPEGINVLIPSLQIPPGLPKVKETIKVLMPIDKKWFTGNCVYVRNESDGSLSMGIHFCDPDEQGYLKELLFSSLNAPGDSHAFISYEWEELVDKLCQSEDPELKKIGHHHLAHIKAEQGRPHWSEIMTESLSGD